VLDPSSGARSAGRNGKFRNTRAGARTISAEVQRMKCGGQGQLFRRVDGSDQARHGGDALAICRSITGDERRAPQRKVQEDPADGISAKNRV
jgi:hypothetical protein